MTAGLSVIALIISVGAVTISYLLYRQARRANDTSEKALKLNRQRIHDESVPRFKFEAVEEGSGSGVVHATLRVHLISPPHLDDVVIKILDEAGQDHWAHGYPDGVTEEMAREFVWGPWQFNSGASAQVRGKRTTVSRPYTAATGRDWDQLQLEETQPGFWMPFDLDQWRSQRRGPLRLLLTCRVGDEEWTVREDIDVQPAPRIY